MMRRSALVAVMALMVAACGTTAPLAGQTTTTQVQTTTQPTSTGSTAPPTTVGTETTTSTIPPTTVATTTPVTPTKQAVVAPARMGVSPWFFIDEAGHSQRTGPFLLPVHREIDATRAIGRASLEQLFRGPTDGEVSGVPSISSTIPEGVEVLGLTIREGIAIVDLSDEFEADDDSAVLAQRMAQVVFTLTSIPHVAEVLIRQEGKPIPAITSTGESVSRPVSKADYLDFAAALTIETPVYAGPGTNPLHVTGFGAVFEAAFSYALADADGLIIAEGHAMTLNGTGWGGFDFMIDYSVSQRQTGALILWANSANDGSRIDIREYPVVLVP